MRITDMDGAALARALDEWLLRNPVPPRFGLEIEEALRRGRELMPLIVAGRLKPSDVTLDAVFKDVLYALVDLLPAAPAGADGASAARSVYRFIRGIYWPDDDLGEKERLLKRCFALAGDAEGTTAVRSIGREDLPEEEARREFERRLPLIHEILVGYNGIAESEARDLERDLLVWFVRFTRRPDTFPCRLEKLLLAACAQFAGEYRRFTTGAPVLPTED